MATTTAYPAQLVLAGQAAAPDGPVDMAGMYLMHHGFRRDLAAFIEAVGRTPASSGPAWQRLAQRWEMLAEILHHHHQTEDDGLWPELLLRVDAAGDSAARQTLADMEAEHSGIDPLLSACAAGFAALAQSADEDARAALEVRLIAAREALHQHLAHEETEAMALVQRYLTPEDVRTFGKEHVQRVYGIKMLTLIVPWGMYGLNATERARAKEEVGAVPVLIWRLFLKRPFERRERAAFGTA